MGSLFPCVSASCRPQSMRTRVTAENVTVFHVSALITLIASRCTVTDVGHFSAGIGWCADHVNMLSVQTVNHTARAMVTDTGVGPLPSPLPTRTMWPSPRPWSSPMMVWVGPRTSLQSPLPLGPSRLLVYRQLREMMSLVSPLLPLPRPLTLDVRPLCLTVTHLTRPSPLDVRPPALTIIHLTRPPIHQTLLHPLSPVRTSPRC